MSKIIFIFLVILSLTYNVHSQVEPKNKILFPDEYSYHFGDNINWAKDDFDDSLWNKVAIDSFPTDEWNGIGWFRMWVDVDSSLIRKRLGFSSQIVGAIDVFIDGRYQFSFGKVGNSVDEEEPLFVKSYLPPQVFVFLKNKSDQNGNSKHLIAIRYSSFLLESPISIGIKPSFKIKIDDFQQLRMNLREIRRSAKTYQMLFIGIFLSFALVHMLLYIFYPQLRANLYFAILMTFSAFLTYLRYDAFFISDPRAYLLNFILLDLSIIFFLLSIQKICYYLLNIKKSKIFSSFIIVTIVLSIIFTLRPFRLWPLMIIFEIVIMIEILRNLFTYISKPKELHIEGSWIILVGLLPIGIIGLYQLLTALNVSREYWEFLDLPLTYYALVGFAITMSVFLSRTFARTNKDLAAQLEQVKLLSEKTLKQELERTELAAENRRKSEELEKARELQISMLPKVIPEIKTADIAVFMKTATEVGGDYYDFELDDDGTLSIAFGDATGHGMQAGSVVTATKSLFKSLAHNNQPAQIQQKISEPLGLMGFNRLVMAMIIAKLKKYNFEISVAGMPFPLVYRSSQKKVEEVVLSGFPLGSFKGFKYHSQKLKFKKNDTVLFMSDGLQEMFNEENEILGDEKVIQAFEESADQSPQQIIDHLISVAQDWAGGHPLEDDMTLMVIKFR